jgi:hypothetical protein
MVNESISKVGLVGRDCATARCNRVEGNQKVMKYLYLIILLSIFSSLFLSCNMQNRLTKKTNSFIEKKQKVEDTIYLYSVAFNDFNLIWYHQNNYIYSYEIRPYRIKRSCQIPVENFLVTDSSFQACFVENMNKDAQCLEHLLDGASIEIRVKGSKSFFSSIDLECCLTQSLRRICFQKKLHMI